MVFASSADALSKGEAMRAVPVLQRARLDIVSTGTDVEAEKDRLLERFVDWAKRFVGELRKVGAWADFCDPCSGLPWYSDGNVVYPEVHGCARILGYSTRKIGAGMCTCTILVHPQWGSAVYPATVFTNASDDDIERAIDAVVPAA